MTAREEDVKTVGRLARELGLSRSTLLYYDSIGLLSPTGRSRAGYRLYSAEDRRRLAAICEYRQAGLSLEEIKNLLDGPRGRTRSILEGRLRQLNGEIARCREQQRIVVDLLKSRKLLRSARSIDKKQWVSILAAAGLDEPAMERWHVEFERSSPEAHQDFLESLSIPADEIELIRRRSRAGAGGSSRTTRGGRRARPRSR